MDISLTMKFVVGGILQESNTFCPEKTTLDTFRNAYLGFGEQILSDVRGSRSFIDGVIYAAEQMGAALHPTVAAFAAPYGVVEAEAFDHLIGELLGRAGEADDADGVVLCLHGGMVAENSLDPEGEILERVRDLFGPGVPVTCTLDMHCNVSRRMVENCDAFYVNNENPHTDSYDRGVEATQALHRIVRGKIKPVMALSKPGMLPPTLHVNPPHSGPMVPILKRAFEMEEDPRVLNVNVGAGFPWCDIPDAGMNVITVVDGDRTLAEELADEISGMLWEARHEFIPSLPKPDEAVERAMAAGEGPVILADVADNPGDGTTEDSTAILRSLMEHGARDAALAVMNDAEALEACIDAGVGSRVTVDLGCKAGLFGEPVSLTGTVRTITDGVFTITGPTYTEERNIGRTAVLDVDGIEVIVTERTHNPMFSDIFRRHGIDPARKRILVVKTFRMHMGSSYRSLAKEIIEVDAPGQASVDMRSFEWTRIPRPMFPIDK